MAVDLRSETPDSIASYLKEVRDYYDETTHLYLAHGGRTLQAGVLSAVTDGDEELATNLYIAAQAGIRPGQRILDAGCGVCGPGIDIARHVDDVTIDAITLSPVQAHLARQLVAEADLTDRIRVHCGDYHDLSFAPDSFDAVIFLESLTYAYDHRRIFSGVWSVLRPNGTIYIKDEYIIDDALTAAEQQDLDATCAKWHARPVHAGQVVHALREAGFADIVVHDLNGTLESRLHKVMFRPLDQFPFPVLTEFGKRHFLPIRSQRRLLWFAAISARKQVQPATGPRTERGEFHE
jgi:SAM-dependent methyltransferase